MATFDHIEAPHSTRETSHEGAFDNHRQPGPGTGSGAPFENVRQAQTETLVRNGTLPSFDIGNAALDAVTRGVVWEATHNPTLLAMNTGMALSGHPIPLMAETAIGTAMANPRAAEAFGEGFINGASGGLIGGTIGRAAGADLGRHVKM